jgi:hypothetical protein
VYNIYITFTYVYLNGTIELWNHLMISAWWNPSFDMIAPHLQGQQKALPCLSQLLAMWTFTCGKPMGKYRETIWKLWKNETLIYNDI